MRFAFSWNFIHVLPYPRKIDIYQRFQIVLHYPQFAPILNDYLSLPEFHDKANETMRAKRVTTTSLCNYLGDIGITSFQDCSSNDVTQFLESISYLASSTKSGRLFILRHFFNYLYRKKKQHLVM